MSVRDYLFRFLRSPDYITDVNHYLPKFLTNDEAFSETQRVLSWEHERYRLKLIDFAKQFQPQTTTWDMSTWEEEYGLTTSPNTDLELRRAILMAKILGTMPMTVANTNKLINLFTSDGKGYVEELPEDGTLKIVLPSKQVYQNELDDALFQMLPAHLAYYFQRVIIIDGKDEDGEGTDDDLGDVNDKAFFMHADFPIVENIPYGKWYNAPKYDGSVQIKAGNSFNNGLRYDGSVNHNSLNPDIARYGKPCNWWFVATGITLFDKEFRHDGAILYDGLKPQEIEYDDGMDELKILEVSNAVEEDVSDKPQFEGSRTFDGTTAAVKSKIPSDIGGSVSILRSVRFNGKSQYDGGDLNYFNGAIRADGTFTFEGDGNKALTEILTDEIDGKANYIKKQKNTELSFRYVECFDFVPVTFGKHTIAISTNTVEDIVEPAIDEADTLTVSKAIRYNGAKRYDAGNVNFYNGEIRADGKFAFVGNGNRAKIEIMAIDSDGTFSMQTIEKETPPVYIENFDFVSGVNDKTKIAAQIDFEDYANSSDGNGELIIRQRSRFNGKLSYYGYFEHPANATKHYDGDLNYNNVYIWRADGAVKFNGAERYGGRRSHTFIEYVGDINGNPKILDTDGLERIPIATRERLGFVIAGDNLDIDDRGKITLSESLQSFQAAEIEAGVLKTIFENRRS